MWFVALKKCFLTDIGLDSVRKGAEQWLNS